MWVNRPPSGSKAHLPPLPTNGQGLPYGFSPAASVGGATTILPRSRTLIQDGRCRSAEVHQQTHQHPSTIQQPQSRTPQTSTNWLQPSATDLTSPTNYSTAASTIEPPPIHPSPPPTLVELVRRLSWDRSGSDGTVISLATAGSTMTEDAEMDTFNCTNEVVQMDDLSTTTLLTTQPPSPILAAMNSPEMMAATSGLFSDGLSLSTLSPPLPSALSASHRKVSSCPFQLNELRHAVGSASPSPSCSPPLQTGEPPSSVSQQLHQHHLQQSTPPNPRGSPHQKGTRSPNGTRSPSGKLLHSPSIHGALFHPYPKSDREKEKERDKLERDRELIITALPASAISSLQSSPVSSIAPSSSTTPQLQQPQQHHRPTVISPASRFLSRKVTPNLPTAVLNLGGPTAVPPPSQSPPLFPPPLSLSTMSSQPDYGMFTAGVASNLGLSPQPPHHSPSSSGEYASGSPMGTNHPIHSWNSPPQSPGLHHAGHPRPPQSPASGHAIQSHPVSQLHLLTSSTPAPSPAHQPFNSRPHSHHNSLHQQLNVPPPSHHARAASYTPSSPNHTAHEFLSSSYTGGVPNLYRCSSGNTSIGSIGSCVSGSTSPTISQPNSPLNQSFQLPSQPHSTVTSPLAASVQYHHQPLNNQFSSPLQQSIPESAASSDLINSPSVLIRPDFSAFDSLNKGWNKLSEHSPAASKCRHRSLPSTPKHKPYNVYTTPPTPNPKGRKQHTLHDTTVGHDRSSSHDHPPSSHHQPRSRYEKTSYERSLIEQPGLMIDFTDLQTPVTSLPLLTPLPTNPSFLEMVYEQQDLGSGSFGDVFSVGLTHPTPFKSNSNQMDTQSTNPIPPANPQSTLYPFAWKRTRQQFVTLNDRGRMLKKYVALYEFLQKLQQLQQSASGTSLDPYFEPLMGAIDPVSNYPRHLVQHYQLWQDNCKLHCLMELCSRGDLTTYWDVEDEIKEIPAPKDEFSSYHPNDDLIGEGCIENADTMMSATPSTIEDIKDQLPPPLTPISELMIWKLIADITSALALMHYFGFFHLDIKPGNLFVTDKEEFKLGDLDSCVLVSERGLGFKISIDQPAPIGNGGSLVSSSGPSTSSSAASSVHASPISMPISILQTHLHTSTNFLVTPSLSVSPASNEPSPMHHHRSSSSNSHDSSSYPWSSELSSLDEGDGLFMAPELLANIQNVTDKCDIYSFGASVYGILNNSLVPKDEFTGVVRLTYQTLKCSISPVLIRLIHEMTLKDPTKRPSARQVFILATTMIKQLTPISTSTTGSSIEME